MIGSRYSCPKERSKDRHAGGVTQEGWAPVSFFPEHMREESGSMIVNGYVMKDIRSGKIKGVAGEPGIDYGTWGANLIQ